jgi:hypothetical protein
MIKHFTRFIYNAVKDYISLYKEFKSTVAGSNQMAALVLAYLWLNDVTVITVPLLLGLFFLDFIIVAITQLLVYLAYGLWVIYQFIFAVCADAWYFLKDILNNVINKD